MAGHSRAASTLLFLYCSSLCCLVQGQILNNGVLVDAPVFRWLSEGYKTFRIPGITQTNNGTLIAAVEGRVSVDKPPVGNASVCYGLLASKYDSRCVDKDIVVKASSDYGATWGAAKALTNSNSTHFYSNPNMVFDHMTHTVWMVYYQCLVSEVYGHCVPLMTSSNDHGRTWTEGAVVEAVSELRIGGLGGGIQLQHQTGSSQNRLILPHDGNGVIYSDDHGETWKAGNHAQGAGGENQAAELWNGNLMMTVRHGGYHPTLCTSTDAGLNFANCKVQEQLLSDNCQTSLLAVPRPTSDQAKHHSRLHNVGHKHAGLSSLSSTILSSVHPNSLNPVEPLGRQNITLSVSHDDGVSWQPAITLNPGPSAYSAQAYIDYKGKPAVAVLYERSKDGPPVDFDTVAMAIVDVETLL